VMCPHVPMFVETVLLPFRDAIITDGLMRSPPMHISFGGDPTRLWVWCGVRTGFAAPHGRVGWRRGQLEHDALAVRRRCQRRTVSGWTTMIARRHDDKRRAPTSSLIRSMSCNLGRLLRLSEDVDLMTEHSGAGVARLASLPVGWP
jgi:hypothetical protein